MLTINKCYTGFILLMSIAQSKRKLIAATALFIAVGSLTGAIVTGGATTITFAQTGGQDGGGGATTGGGAGQQGGQQGRIVQQGTVTSGPFPLPGPDFEEDQGAEILPLMQNNVYSGVLTYTASEAVSVAILNVQQDLNETQQAILNGTEDGEFGTLTTSQLDNQTSVALTVLPAAASGSIPFTGNGIWLHTDGTLFAASYAVSAQTLQPETVNEISNATLTADEDGDEDADAAGDEDADAAGDEDADADDGVDGAVNGNATDGDDGVDGAVNGNATDGDGEEDA
jgi:hypothetical protein